VLCGKAILAEGLGQCNFFSEKFLEVKVKYNKRPQCFENKSEKGNALLKMKA